MPYNNSMKLGEVTTQELIREFIIRVSDYHTSDKLRKKQHLSVQSQIIIVIAETLQKSFDQYMEDVYDAAGEHVEDARPVETRYDGPVLP